MPKKYENEVERRTRMGQSPEEAAQATRAMQQVIAAAVRGKINTRDDQNKGQGPTRLRAREEEERRRRALEQLYPSNRGARN